MTTAPVWQRATNLLAVRLDNLGDVLMTTPALRAMRGPGSPRRVTLLASRGGAAVVPHVPEIDDVIVFDAPWVAGGDDRDDGDPVQRCVQVIRSRNFDAAVVFSVYSQSVLPAATMLYQAGVPAVIGRSRENPYRLLTDWIREDEPEETVRHEVRRQLDLVARVGYHTEDEQLSFRADRVDRDAAREVMADSGVSMDQPYVVLHPGASAASRRYPAPRFGAAARLINQRTGWPIVITGSADEAALAATVRDACGPAARSMAGRLSLGALGAVIAGARVLVGNNSGPVHIAAAVGTPIVDLYALTNPQHTPWRVPSRVLYREVACAFCYSSRCRVGHHRCLLDITPDDVAEAVDALMAGQGEDDRVGALD